MKILLPKLTNPSNFMHIFNKNSKILIIGGSKGIGKEIYNILKKLNNNITIGCRTINKQSNFIEIDITNSDSLNKIDQFYDFVFCCPGICHSEYLYNSTEKNLLSQFHVNFLGPYNVIKRVIDLNDSLYKNKKSTIILFSSVASMLGIPGYDLYGCSKSALNHLFYTIQNREWKGIEMKLLILGNVKTEGFLEENICKPVLLKELESNSKISKPQDVALFILENIHQRSVIAEDWMGYFLCIKYHCEKLQDYFFFPVAVLFVMLVKIYIKFKFRNK